MSKAKAKRSIPEVYAARTDVGCVREHNEDTFVAQSPVFAVADGMGGHESGEVASEIAIETLVARAPSKPDGDALAAAIMAANTAILRGVEEGKGRAGMGTTIIAAQIFGEQLVLGQVGDSRAYLLHEGNLQRLTRDHSLVADMVAQGHITEEEARVHPQRSVITRALGSDITVEPDIYILRISEGDRLMLCSDGLCGMVDDATIEKTMRANDDVNECCDALIEAALDAGGSDNVTVVVVDPFSDASKSKPTQRKASEEPKPKKRFLAPLIWVAAVLVICIGACAGVYAYAQNSYYVILENDQVNIYRGIPGKVGPFELSWLEEETDITSDDLAPTTAQRLKDGEAAGSLSEAESLIETYQDSKADSNTAKKEQ